MCASLVASTQWDVDFDGEELWKWSKGLQTSSVPKD